VPNRRPAMVRGEAVDSGPEPGLAWPGLEIFADGVDVVAEPGNGVGLG
jgi:hypothetical protein